LKKNKPSASPDFQAELKTFLTKHNALNSHPKNYFGVTLDNPPRILIQDAFVEEAVRGYEELQPIRADVYRDRIDYTKGHSRPTVTHRELRSEKLLLVVRCTNGSMRPTARRATTEVLDRLRTIEIAFIAFAGISSDRLIIR
jgi:hypothetical protein